nr:hypothetical protein [Tanacetum cinerariifolium]
MASFDYRLKPLYPIKECSTCGALYTTDYCCSEGFLRDKIICDLNKTPDLSQRPPQNCPKCENPVDGQYCQGYALLRKKFKEDMFTYCIENGILQGLLDISKPSNDNTNVVNAPQEPFIVKQDPDKNSSKSPPHINHHCCYGCGDSLEDIFCHQCTCESCGKGAHFGYNCLPKQPIIPNLEPCNNQTIDELPQTFPSFDPTCYSEDGNSFTYDSKSNLVDDSPNVFNPPSQPSTHLYEFCGNDAYYGHDCPLQIPFTYDPEPCYNQDFNFPQNFQIFQQQYLCCTCCGGPHETCKCDQLIFDEPYCENYGGSHMSFQCQLMNQNHYETNPCYDSNSFDFDQFQPLQFPVIHQPIREKTCAELLAEERTANINTQPFYVHKYSDLDRLTICYNDDDDEDCTIAITPILSTEEPNNSLSMGDEHLDTIPEMKSDEVIKSSVENLVRIPSKSEGIPDNMCDVPFHDNSPPLDTSKDQFEDFFDSNDDSTSIDDDSFSIDNIEYIKALKDNPTPSFDFMAKSSSTSPNFFLEETNTFDNSLPESETFCFDSEENSSGSTTTHSDFSLYDSFIFDLSINPFPPADRSDFYEFVDELAHIISSPEYDCFSFKNEPNSRDFTMDLVEDIFPTR